MLTYMCTTQSSLWPSKYFMMHMCGAISDLRCYRNHAKSLFTEDGVRGCEGMGQESQTGAILLISTQPVIPEESQLQSRETELRRKAWEWKFFLFLRVRGHVEDSVPGRLAEQLYGGQQGSSSLIELDLEGGREVAWKESPRHGHRRVKVSFLLLGPSAEHH